MIMLNNGFKLLIAGFLISSVAFPCGDGLGAIRPGNKVVGIEIKSEKGGPSKWLMDDDGMLVLSLVAAYCRNGIDYLRGEFTDAQAKCADDFQRTLKIPYDDQIDTLRPPKGGKSKGNLNRKIKAECGFDMLAIWKKSIEKREAKPITCVDEVKGIVKKAATRSEEYLKEESDPMNLASLNTTADSVKSHLASLKADADYSKSMVELFSETPVTTGKFEKWLEEISDVIDSHMYQVVDDPNDKFNPEKQRPLGSILSSVSARLPGVASSMCGRFPVEVIKQLQTAVWDVRGTGQGLQGGQGTDAGAGK